MFIKGIKPLSENPHNTPAFCNSTALANKTIGRNIATLGVPDTFSKKAPPIQYAVIDGKLHVKFNQPEGSDKAFIKKAKMKEPELNKESTRKLKEYYFDEDDVIITPNGYDNPKADILYNETVFGTDV